MLKKGQLMLFLGKKHCVGSDLGMLHEVDEHVLALAVGNDDADAGLLNLRGCGILRLHAAPTS